MKDGSREKERWRNGKSERQGERGIRKEKKRDNKKREKKRKWIYLCEYVNVSIDNRTNATCGM